MQAIIFAMKNAIHAFYYGGKLTTAICSTPWTSNAWFCGTYSRFAFVQWHSPLILPSVVREKSHTIIYKQGVKRD